MAMSATVVRLSAYHIKGENSSGRKYVEKEFSKFLYRLLLLLFHTSTNLCIQLERELKSSTQLYSCNLPANITILKWIMSGPKTNFYLLVIHSTSHYHYTTSLSFFFKPQHKLYPQIENANKKTTTTKQWDRFWSLFIFCGQSTWEPASTVCNHA